jgi:hypothetical protein
MNAKSVLRLVAVALFLAPVTAKAQDVFRPPFRSDDSCDRSVTVGYGSVSYRNNPSSGDMLLGVRTRFFGQMMGRTGVGVRYTPNFTGRAVIKAFVSVKPASNDATYLFNPGLKIPQKSVVALNSDVFVKLDGDEPGTYRFRSTDGNTLMPGKTDLLLLAFPDLRTIFSWLPWVQSNTELYPREQLYVAERTVNMSRGITRRICGGVQANLLSATLPFPLAAGTAAHYEARLMKITVERR